MKRQASVVAPGEIQQCVIAEKIKEELEQLIPALEKHAKCVGGDQVGYGEVGKVALSVKEAIFCDGKLGVQKEDVLLTTLKLLSEAQDKFIKCQKEYEVAQEQQVSKLLLKWLREGYIELEDEKNMLKTLKDDRDLASIRGGSSAEELERKMRVSMLYQRQQKRLREVLDKLPAAQKAHGACIKKLLQLQRDMHMACGNAANTPFMMLLLNSQRD